MQNQNDDDGGVGGDVVGNGDWNASTFIYVLAEMEMVNVTK